MTEERPVTPKKSAYAAPTLRKRQRVDEVLEGDEVALTSGRTG